MVAIQQQNPEITPPNQKSVNQDKREDYKFPPLPLSIRLPFIMPELLRTSIYPLIISSSLGILYNHLHKLHPFSRLTPFFVTLLFIHLLLENAQKPVKAVERMFPLEEKDQTIPAIRRITQTIWIGIAGMFLFSEQVGKIGSKTLQFILWKTPQPPLSDMDYLIQELAPSSAYAFSTTRHLPPLLHKLALTLNDIVLDLWSLPKPEAVTTAVLLTGAILFSILRDRKQKSRYTK